MHQPNPASPTAPANKSITKDLVCRQILELADMAREARDFETALEALSLIAQIQGFYTNE